MTYETVIGLEVHAELATRSKMFCACPVVDSTRAEPNTAVCPVCSGLPGALPVVNRGAVELALRAALALECAIAPVSIFARKNYFYPDLPKGYQISQYEEPLAVDGRLEILTPDGPRQVRIRRVHLEEDTGKLTHLGEGGEARSLVDLNRSGLPLLEIVSEPDLHSAAEARIYGQTLRSLLRALSASTGDMQKGAIRFEANVSIRPAGAAELGTRVEIKNLNSFRAMERAITYEVERQSALLDQGLPVRQETLGWDEARGATVSQRGKEEAHDYRYFPEPDLPPLTVEPVWIDEIRRGLPELPAARARRLAEAGGLAPAEAARLAGDTALAEYYEAAAAAAPQVEPRTLAHWLLGELTSLLNERGDGIEECPIPPIHLADLVDRLRAGEINPASARLALADMYASGRTPEEIIRERGLRQRSDPDEIAALVTRVLAEHPAELASYRAGKTGLAHWLFGQVARAAGSQADPRLIRAELDRQLQEA